MTLTLIFQPNYTAQDEYFATDDGMTFSHVHCTHHIQNTRIFERESDLVGIYKL